jgi:hypothetical protein
MVQLNVNKENGPTVPHVFSDNDNFKNFLGISFGCLLLVIVTFYIWKKCLFEKYGAFIPLDKNIIQQ